MSISSEKGKTLENKIASILRSKLGSRVIRDKRSGAGTNKSDINDWWGELPIFIEAKNQKTIKIKEFFKQAQGGASMGQVPTVVFNLDNEELLACLPFSDLVNFLVEIQDYKTIVEDLREPIKVIDKAELVTMTPEGLSYIEKETHSECRAGHLSDNFGYCNQLACKFSRGYRPLKVKKK